LQQAWTAGQNKLAQLLPNTPHRIATMSSHYVQIEAPQLEIEIRQVIEAAPAEKPPWWPHQTQGE
jgi:hypothetical protein